MKLKFTKQQYQEEAVASVVKCFEGQKKGNITEIVKQSSVLANEGTFWEEIIEQKIVAFGNKKIELTQNEIRNNIRNVQKLNQLDYTDNQGINNLSVEMETGTGKTYTYIKTIYELNKTYGWSKFIIIVPSIAIREGVLKTFQITKEHFEEQYDTRLGYFVYNSENPSNISNINSFAENPNIEVMIMNYQAFNAKTKANKRIYKERDDLLSETPIDVIKATNPILIIDEPQKMGNTEKMLSEFNPLFNIRYSATHKENREYNMIYKLDAVEAYRKRLVKKINVKGIEILNNKTENTYLYLESVEIGKGEPTAKIEMEIKKKGNIKRVEKTLRKGDNLYNISGELEEYKGYIITNIDARNKAYDKVTFKNGEEIYTGQVLGDKEGKYMTRIQIRETIKSHFEKEKEYYKLGIKVLSLFFIDEVAKYKIYDENRNSHNGEYAKIFEEEYNKIYNEYYNNAEEEYKKYLDFIKDEKVHLGYFSIDKKHSGERNGEPIYIDSDIDDKKSKISADKEAYDLIMKDKERLLSLKEPVRFIFSHSALREGWDNPNIFQICTLKKSNSKISKRQEIGRGLRICVNQDGERMDYNELEDDFFFINNLTVIASESYDSFAKGLQNEMAEELSEKIPEQIVLELFIDKKLRNPEGEEVTIDQPIFTQILLNCMQNEYIDQNGKVTEKFKDDLEENTLKVPDTLQKYEKQYTEMMQKIFGSKDITIGNENKCIIKGLKLNDNFNEKSFQKLWNKINTKTVYEVKFDTNKLIENSIKSLDEQFKIGRMRAKITIGEQKDNITGIQVKEEKSMNVIKSETQFYETADIVNTKYDLIGNISKDTQLTRKTIIEILSRIKRETFEQYKYNAEEFIKQVTKIINTEKAIAIVNGVKYKKTNEKYDISIFNAEKIKGRLGENAIEVKKNIYDYLITDSKTERKFAIELENGEVKVYAKLPKAFKIATPVGNYSPDWAIVFNNKKFKYVYFVAETKGNTDKLELRGIENAKIECARKHFEAISDESVGFDVISNYDELINNM